MSIRALHYITGDTPYSGFRRIGGSEAFPADQLDHAENDENDYDQYGQIAQVFADGKEGRHGWVVLAVLHVVDVGFSLAEGEAHVTGGNTFLHTQVRETCRKFFLIHGNAPFVPYNICCKGAIHLIQSCACIEMQEGIW